MPIDNAWPKNAMPMNDPMASWRWSMGTTSAMRASEIGIVAAAKMPVSARKKAIPVSVVPTAHSAVANCECHECAKDYARLAESVGKRAEYELEDAEGQHIGCNQDSRSCRLNANALRDRGEYGRNDPVVGHNDESGRAEQ